MASQVHFLSFSHQQNLTAVSFLQVRALLLLHPKCKSGNSDSRNTSFGAIIRHCWVSGYIGVREWTGAASWRFFQALYQFASGGISISTQEALQNDSGPRPFSGPLRFDCDFSTTPSTRVVAFRSAVTALPAELFRILWQFIVRLLFRSNSQLAGFTFKRLSSNNPLKPVNWIE
jgi:hypothetical protein